MRFRKVLRGAAIALIAFPEPVTTAAGVAILVASYAIPRAKGPDNPDNLRHLVKSYMKVAVEFRPGWSGTSRPNPAQPQLYPKYSDVFTSCDTASPGIFTQRISYPVTAREGQLYVKPIPAAGGRPVYHPLNTKLYNPAPGLTRESMARQIGLVGVTSAGTVVHHSLNASPVACMPALDVSPASVIEHKLIRQAAPVSEKAPDMAVRRSWLSLPEVPPQAVHHSLRRIPYNAPARPSPEKVVHHTLAR